MNSKKRSRQEYESTQHSQDKSKQDQTSLQHCPAHQIDETISLLQTCSLSPYILRQKAIELNSNPSFLQRNAYKTNECQLMNKFQFCVYGTKCDWYHHKQEQRQPICTFYLLNKNCKNACCKFSHNLQDVLPFPPPSDSLSSPIYKRSVFRIQPSSNQYNTTYRLELDELQQMFSHEWQEIQNWT